MYLLIHQGQSTGVTGTSSTCAHTNITQLSRADASQGTEAFTYWNWNWRAEGFLSLNPVNAFEMCFRC
jgi:hypothetical protein